MPDTVKKYDVVIIGSGLGGLLCGAILAKHGKKVCVLEKHNKIGGNLQVFKRKGCAFSAGMHYAGSLGKGQILQKVFSYLGIYNGLEITPLNKNCFDKILIGNKEYAYASGMENFKNKLLHSFPTESEAIEKYTTKLEEIWDKSDQLNLRDTDFSAMPTYSEFNDNAFDFIDSLTDNDELKAVLAATNGLYIGSKQTTPLYIHANINNFFIKSAWRVADNGENLAILLEEVIEKNGGGVWPDNEVTSFEFDGQIIKSAKTASGQQFYADEFISSIHPAITLKLLPEKAFRKAYIQRIQNLENSISAFSLFIVLKKKTFKHINSNIYYFNNNNVWDMGFYKPDEWPKGYMMYTTEDINNKGFAESMVLITMMKFDEVEQWENTTIEKRGPEYKAFKNEKSEIILDLVSVKFPELRNAIDTVYSASPLTYRDYTGTPRGSIYGVVKNCNDPLRTFISPKTKIPNLYLTGQNLSLHGMLGVVMTAFQTCSIIIDINELYKKIRNS